MVRAGVGGGLPGVSRGEAAGANRQRQPGAPADLQALCGPLEALRAGARRLVRAAREQACGCDLNSPVVVAVTPMSPLSSRARSSAPTKPKVIMARDEGHGV